MNPQAPGPELRDIHLPPAPGWWPPAPGWWVVAAILLLLAVFLLWKLAKNLHQSRRQRLLLAEFEAIRAGWREHGDTAALVAAVSAFLRRLALRVEPAAAARTGAEWLAFLDRHGDGFAAQREALLNAPWRPQASVDAEALLATTERHLRRTLATELRHV